MNRDDRWYEYYDRKPGMRWNRAMVLAFVGCLAVDCLILWALIRAIERWAN